MFKDEYEDPLFQQAKNLVIEKNLGSVSLLQRQFLIGYNRAERLMNELERKGVVGPFNGVSPREIIYSPLEIEVAIVET